MALIPRVGAHAGDGAAAHLRQHVAAVQVDDVALLAALTRVHGDVRHAQSDDIYDNYSFAAPAEKLLAMSEVVAGACAIWPISCRVRADSLHCAGSA